MIGLDTCAIIDLLNDEIDVRILEETFAISVLVKFEFLAGANAQETKIFDELWQKSIQIEVTDELTNVAIRNKISARKKGMNIPIVDCIIGTSYAQLNIPIVTRNKKDFEHLQGLKIISY